MLNGGGILSDGDVGSVSSPLGVYIPFCFKLWLFPAALSGPETLECVSLMEAFQAILVLECTFIAEVAASNYHYVIIPQITAVESFGPE